MNPQHDYVEIGGRRFLTTKRISEIMGVRRHTINAWVQKYDMPGFTIGTGHTMLFAEDDVLAWIEAFSPPKRGRPAKVELSSEKFDADPHEAKAEIG